VQKRVTKGENKMSKLRKKTTATLLIAVFMISMFAVAIPVSADYGEPTIDGVINSGEWGAPTFQNDGYFNVYVLNDAEYLYVAFETLGGTYLPTGDGDIGMMNLYTMNPDTGECWAYCWIHRTPDLIELHYSPPRTLRPNDAQFAVTETVFELQVPLSELESISLGDTINFNFLSYAQGWTDWSTCWLFGQEYTLELPPQIWFKASGGGESYDDSTGDHCTLGVIGMSLESSTGIGDRVLSRGSGTFIDHELKLKVSFNIEEGAIVRQDNLIYF